MRLERSDKIYNKELLQSEPNFNYNYRAAPYMGLTHAGVKTEQHAMDNFNERAEQIG